MIYSFAPMEGVTSYIYRRIHARMFPGADVYYAPFIAPDGNGNYKISSFRDTLPENNPGLALVPQLLCSSAAPFISARLVPSSQSTRAPGCCATSPRSTLSLRISSLPVQSTSL